MIKKFAYLINPLSAKQYRNFFYVRSLIPPLIFKLFSKKTWPFQIYKIDNPPGYFIALPMIFKQTEDQILLAMEKILDAVDIAKRLEVKIMGLGGYTSLLCDKGYTALRTLKIPLTSGSTLTAWSAYEAVFRMAKIRGLDLRASKVAIINSTGAIGSLCARKISECSAKLVLNSHPDMEFKLKHLKETILHLNLLDVAIETDASLAVCGADIIIVTSDIPEAVFKLESVKLNAIICDATVNHKYAQSAKSRPDIVVLRAGLIKIPKPIKLRVNTGLPPGIIPASMAETMLLVQEGKFASYSLGENINLDKMEEIADIAARHAFEVWVPQAPVL